MTREEKMMHMYTLDYMSYQQIADAYGISRQRVGQILTPLGVSRAVVSSRRFKRETELRNAHARIESRTTTPEEEAERLGFATVGNLQNALGKIGLRFSRVRILPPHGTMQRYRYRGKEGPCRCRECKDANNRASAERRGQPPRVHGTMSGYQNYGCKCAECKAAARLWRQENRKKTKEVTESA